MHTDKTDDFIKTFMQPTVFTGVKPLFIVAEELATDKHIGSVIDAVWVGWDEGSVREFKYITKFAVEGKILDRKYYSDEELEPFKGRLALPNEENFKKLLAHRNLKEEIEEVKAERNALGDLIESDFDQLDTLLDGKKEVCVFQKGHGDWTEPFHEIDIDMPYLIISKADSEGEYILKHPKTGKDETYDIEETFYAFIIGGKAEISGLRLKDESFKDKIEELKREAKEVLKSIAWLGLDDPRVTAIKASLPLHPFDEYFNYVKKGEERKVAPPEHLIRAMELIVEEHMPNYIGPLGLQYIPIDNLLYLFHEIIPRPEALEALKACDVIHEPSGLLLGYEGKHVMPPKFLVPVNQVVDIYQKFDGFTQACERYLKKQ